MVRKHEAPQRSQQRVGSRSAITAGLKVKSRYKGEDIWMDSIIVVDNGDGTYEVVYYDIGGEALTVPEQDIKVCDQDVVETTEGLPSATYPFFKGQRVWAQFNATDIKFDAKVSQVNGDGTYHIDYSNGKHERWVSADLIEAIDLSEEELKSRPPITGGMRVQARRGRGSTWVDGRVAPIEGFLFVVYDKGDHERLPEEYIRFPHPVAEKPENLQKENNPKLVPPKPVEIGVRVEATFDNKCAEGVVWAAYDDGTCDVMFYDGDVKKGIPSSSVKILEAEPTPTKKFSPVVEKHVLELVKRENSVAKSKDQDDTTADFSQPTSDGWVRIIPKDDVSVDLTADDSSVSDWNANNTPILDSILDERQEQSVSAHAETPEKGKANGLVDAAHCGTGVVDEQNISVHPLKEVPASEGSTSVGNIPAGNDVVCEQEESADVAIPSIFQQELEWAVALKKHAEAPKEETPPPSSAAHDASSADKANSMETAATTSFPETPGEPPARELVLSDGEAKLTDPDDSLCSSVSGMDEAVTAVPVEGLMREIDECIDEIVFILDEEITLRETMAEAKDTNTTIVPSPSVESEEGKPRQSTKIRKFLKSPFGRNDRASGS